MSIPDESEFRRVADLTALRRSVRGDIYESNYARGPLLYALVAARRPLATLEFGTGRGYGALCMSWAMADLGLEGAVSTIDVVAQGEPLDWLYRDERGVHQERTSREAFWRSRFPADWVDRIVPLRGRSVDAVARLRSGASFDLAFVDGGHDHATARHDLLAAGGLGSDRLGILIDDYVRRPGFGVVQAMAELVPEAPVTIITTSWGEIDGGGAGGMAWLDLSQLPSVHGALRQRWQQRSLKGWRARLIGR